MKYEVSIRDEATYIIEAENEYEAQDKADEWFCERQRYKDEHIFITEIPEISVIDSRLTELMESFVETFNDCACCPISNDCIHRERGGMDVSYCAQLIIANHLLAEEG